MSTIGATIELDGLANFKAAMQTAGERTRTFSAELRGLAAEASGTGRGLIALKSENEVYTRSIQNSKDKLSLISQTLATARVELDKKAAALRKATEEQGANSKAARDAQSAYDRQVATVARFERQLAVADAEVKTLTASFDKNESTIKNIERGYNDAGKEVNEFGEEVREAGEAANSATAKTENLFKSLIGGGLVLKALQQVFQAVKGSVSGAISRVDTLARYPQIMEKMGYESEVAEQSIKKLSDGIQGLPTALDDIVANTRQFVVALNDLDKGTESALALNNAFLASGASGYEASRGMVQYLQMLSSGKVDMQSWNTLNQTMTYALQTTAESFGFAGAAAKTQLYSAIQDGDITFQQFNARIVELNEGVGGFAEVAQTSTGGIGTAWTNLQTAIVRGTANIIAAFDKGLEGTRFKSIENVIKSSGKKISDTLNVVAKVAGFLAENIEAILPPVIAAAAGFGILKAKAAIAPIFNAASAAMKAMTTATLVQTQSQAAQFVSLTALSIARKKEIASTIASIVQTSGLTLAQTVQAAVTGILAGKIGVATAAQWVWNAAMAANPLGAVIMLIVAAIAAIAAIANALKKANKEYYAEKDALKELTKAHEGYAEALRESKDAASEDAHAKIAQAQHNRSLLDSLANLVDGNGKYAGSAEEAIYAVMELSENIDGLGLAFDETTGHVNMSAQELRKYGEHLESIARYDAAQQEYNNILSERNSLQAKISALEEKQKLYNERVEGGTLTQRQGNKVLKETQGLLDGYGESLKGLEDDVMAYEAAMKNAYNTEDEIAVRRQGIINNQSRDVRKFAYQYTLTADDVLDAASKMQGGLDEWAQHMEETHTKEGLSLDQVAIKWGTTAEAIDEEMNNMGITLQEWHDQQQEAWDDFQKAVSSHTDSVINSFKEIPAEYEMSAEDMIEVLRTNRERYAEWRQAMTEISSQVSAETLAEFEKLGPGALSAINEMRDNGGAGLKEFDDLIRSTVGDATDYAIQEWDDPVLINAPSNALDNAAQVVSGNTNLSTALTGQIEEAIDSAETVAESKTPPIGSAMNAGVVAGLERSKNMVINKFSGIIQEAILKARHDAGIESPSKQTTWIGEMLGKGLPVGLNKSIPNIRQAIDNVNKVIYRGLVNETDITIGANAQAKGLSALISSGIDVNIDYEKLANAMLKQGAAMGNEFAAKINGMSVVVNPREFTRELGIVT